MVWEFLARIGSTAATLLTVWLLWEIMSLFLGSPYDAEEQRYLRPAFGLLEWYLRRRAE